MAPGRRLGGAGLRRRIRSFPASVLGIQGAVAGTAALSLTGSGSAFAEAIVAGNSSITLVASGAVTNSAGVSGTATMTLSASGTAFGDGAVAGAASMTLAATGTVATGGAVAGTSTMQLDASGTVAGGGQVAGAAAMALSASGAVLADGAVSGAAAMQLAGSGALIADAAVAGAATMQLSGSGAVLADGEVAGTASMQLTGSGTAAGDGAISGSTTMALSASGAAFGDGAIAGTATAALSASGGVYDGTFGFKSDDFNAAAIKPFWTEEDPLSDCTFSIDGFGGGDVRQQIDIPSGTTHDWWTDDKNCPRLTQPVANGDFQITAKWNTEPSSNAQAQGILVMEDDTKGVRFNALYYSGGPLRATAARIDGAAADTWFNAPVSSGDVAYLRVTRTGNNWKFETSPNGSSWTTRVSAKAYTMTVNKIGVFALTSGADPAWSAECDWVEEANDPISGEDS